MIFNNKSSSPSYKSKKNPISESPGVSPTAAGVGNFYVTNGSKNSNLDFSSTLATTGVAPGRRGSMEEYQQHSFESMAIVTHMNSTGTGQ
jgi:hypothetical protein